MTYLRKRPRQARSQATFEAIVEATAHILAEDGSEALTTNRIAARAGVSIGSLYQYFPNRKAIVRALLEDQFRRAEARRPAVIDDAGAPRAERVRALVDWYCDVHGDNPSLVRALAGLSAKVLSRDEMQALEQLRQARALRTIASLGCPEGTGLEVAVFIVVTCLDAICDQATQRHPGWLREDSVRREVAALLGSYLWRPAPSP